MLLTVRSAGTMHGDSRVSETVDFIRRSLPDQTSRVIEVGCGNGEVAAELLGLGIEVIGIDADAEAVEAARERGVNAHLAVWPDFDVARCDAIIFSRSLHHIDNLDGAIGRASEALKSCGRIVVEDFAYGEAWPPMIEWFANQIRQLACADTAFLSAIANSDRPHRAWREQHDHHLHAYARMAAACREKFTILHESVAPYLFRYVPSQFSRQILQGERQFGAHMLGRRLVGER